MGNSTVIKKVQCPDCLDSGQDNLAVYADSSSFCYGCNQPKTYSGAEVVVQPKFNEPLIEGSYAALPKRGINEKTCKFFGYKIGKYTGKMGNDYVKDEWVRIAQYCDEMGRTVKQKIKTSDKKIKQVGNTKFSGLYGKWLWQQNQNLFITITEGEEDAMAVAQAFELQFPVVSIDRGAGKAADTLKEDLQWLLGFKYIVLAFDNDEAGKKATEECIKLFEVDKVRVCTWLEKDANDMLVHGREKELRNCVYHARSLEPNCLVTVEDIIGDVLKRPTTGKPYPWPTLTEITYGFQPGIIVLVGANGIGKTEIVRELIFQRLEEKEKVGLFSFEQAPDSTIRRLVGSRLGVKLHLPGESWDEEQVRQEAMKFNNYVYLYKQSSSVDLINLKNYIRYLVKVKGVSFIIIDNLKGLQREKGHDFGHMKEFMLEFQAMVLEFGITFLLLSHVAKDKIGRQAYVSTSPKRAAQYAAQTSEDVQKMIMRPGMEWESGRMPTKENVEGESAVTDLADYVFAIARNTTSDDETERNTTVVKCLKARLDGSKTGKIFKLVYTNSGKLEELAGIQTQKPSFGVF